MTNHIDELLTQWADCERTGDARGSILCWLTTSWESDPSGSCCDKAAWLGRLGPDLRYDELALDEVSTTSMARPRSWSAISTPSAPRWATRPRRNPSVFHGGPRRRPSLRIAGMQYSYIGSPFGGAVMTATATWKPPRAQRGANLVLSWLLRRGRGPAFMRLLTVTGRATGRARRTPVVPVRDDGNVWVVSPFGEVAWVRNVRAAGRLELHRGRRARAYVRARIRSERRDAGAAPVPLHAIGTVRSSRLRCHQALVPTRRSPRRRRAIRCSHSHR